MLSSPCQFKVINRTKSTISIFGSTDCRKSKCIETSGGRNESGRDERNETEKHDKAESKVIANIGEQENEGDSNENDGNERKETEENEKVERKIIANEEEKEIETDVLIYLGDKTINNNIQRNPNKNCDKFTSQNCEYKEQNKTKKKKQKNSTILSRRKRSALQMKYRERVPSRDYEDESKTSNELDSCKNNMNLNVTNSGRRCKKLLVRRRNLQMLSRIEEETTTASKPRYLSQEKETNAPNTYSTVCTTNHVYTNKTNNSNTSDTTFNQTMLQNSSLRGAVRLVRKCVNRKLRHFHNNQTNTEHTKIPAVHANAQKSEMEMISEPLEATIAPSRGTIKRRRKKKDKDGMQSQRNRSRKAMQIVARNTVSVVTENQKTTLPPSLLAQATKTALPTVVSTIFNYPSDATTMLSSNEDGVEFKLTADINEEVLQPTPALNTHIGSITQTSLSYEIATSIRYETVIRTRTYTYIVDRVHDDQHHYIESSTLVRQETQIEPHNVLSTHTLSHVLVQKVVTPSAMS